MTTQWDKAKGMLDKHDGQGTFVKLSNHGDKVIGAFCGEPYAREVHWTGETTEECVGEGCEYCAKNKKPSMRVKINFFVPDDMTMKVVEGGVTWFKDVIKVREKYGLAGKLFEIERIGEAGNKKTKYSILPDSDIDEALAERIAMTDLHDLDPAEQGQADYNEATETSGGSETISTEAAAEFKARLKVLHRDQLGDFLKTFKIQKIKDLRADDEFKARSFLDSLNKDGNDEDVDPFE